MQRGPTQNKDGGNMNLLEDLKAILEYPEIYDIVTALRGPDIDGYDNLLKCIFTAPLRAILLENDSLAMKRKLPLREYFASFEEFESKWAGIVELCNQPEYERATRHFLHHFTYGARAIQELLILGASSIPMSKSLGLLRRLALTTRNGHGYIDATLLREIWDHEGSYTYYL